MYIGQDYCIVNEVLGMRQMSETINIYIGMGVGTIGFVWALLAFRKKGFPWITIGVSMLFLGIGNSLAFYAKDIFSLQYVVGLLLVIIGFALGMKNMRKRRSV